MRWQYVLITMLLLTGCAGNSYNQIKFKAGVTIPLPIMPIDIGVTLELKDALEETLTDEEIFQRLVDQAILDGWLAVPDPTEPDGLRPPGPSEGNGDGRTPDGSGGSGEGGEDIGDSGEGAGDNGTDDS